MLIDAIDKILEPCDRAMDGMTETPSAYRYAIWQARQKIAIARRREALTPLNIECQESEWEPSSHTEAFFRKKLAFVEPVNDEQIESYAKFKGFWGHPFFEGEVKPFIYRFPIPGKGYAQSDTVFWWEIPAEVYAQFFACRLTSRCVRK